MFVRVFKGSNVGALRTRIAFWRTFWFRIQNPEERFWVTMQAPIAGASGACRGFEKVQAQGLKVYVRFATLWLLPSCR